MKAETLLPWIIAAVSYSSFLVGYLSGKREEREASPPRQTFRNSDLPTLAEYARERNALQKPVG